MTQLLAIFRAPLDRRDFDGEDVFVELEFDENGLAVEGEVFTTGNEDSSYRLMGFDHIVISERIEGGSQDIARFQLKRNDGQPAVIHEMDHYDLEMAVLFMWQDFKRDAQ